MICALQIQQRTMIPQARQLVFSEYASFEIRYLPSCVLFQNIKCSSFSYFFYGIIFLNEIMMDINGFS